MGISTMDDDATVRQKDQTDEQRETCQSKIEPRCQIPPSSPRNESRFKRKTAIARLSLQSPYNPPAVSRNPEPTPLPQNFVTANEYVSLGTDTLLLTQTGTIRHVNNDL